VGNDFRVACGVAQRNLGYGYVGTALEVLNIEPGVFCTLHEDLMDKKVSSDKNRKATRNSSIAEINFGVKNPVKTVKKKLRREKLMKLLLL